MQHTGVGNCRHRIWGDTTECPDVKHKSRRKEGKRLPGLTRGGTAGPVLLDEGRGVALPGTGAGEGVVGLARPSKPGMAELGILKLNCSRCLSEPAAQRKHRL